MAVHTNRLLNMSIMLSLCHLG